MHDTRSFWLLAWVAVAPCAAPLAAQDPGDAQCPERVVVPGGSNPDDHPVHRCRLDEVPGLRSSLDGLPTPMYDRTVHGRLTVVVDADGSVDRDLTRPLTRGPDSVFHRKMLAAVLRLEHEVGVLDGESTRYGYELVLISGRRADSIPQRLVWRRVPGVVTDSLVGTWEPAVPDPPLSRQALAAAVESVTRVLREMQVLLPGQRRSYCLLVDGEDQNVVRRAVRAELARGFPPMHPPGLAPSGCERDVRTRRYRIGEPLRTGGGRTVIEASGDFLRRWPPGLHGRWHPAWTAYCVVPDEPEEWAGTQCDVSGVRAGDPVVDGWAPPLVRMSESARDSVRFTVEFTTSDRFRTDTLRGSIPEVPSLRERAVFDPGWGLCARRSTFAAWAGWPGRGEVVVRLVLTVDESPGGSGSVELHGVRHPEGELRFRGQSCPDSVRTDRPFALFTLGGVGEPLAGPVEFCLNEPGCARSYRIEAGRHELAAEPHLRFRLSDMRPGSRGGTWLQLLLTVDRRVVDLTPFVIVRWPGGSHGWVLRRHDQRAWIFSINKTPPYPPESEFLVYLVRKGPDR